MTDRTYERSFEDGRYQHAAMEAMAYIANLETELAAATSNADAETTLRLERQAKDAKTIGEMRAAMWRLIDAATQAIADPQHFETVRVITLIELHSAVMTAERAIGQGVINASQGAADA